MAKKQRTSADDVLRMMYPDLPTSDDVAPKKDDKPAEKDPAQTIAELQAQIARLEGTVSAAGSHSAPAQTVRQEQVPVAPVHDYSQAPDPAVDPKGYAAFVLAESKKDVEYEKAVFLYQQRQAQTQTNKVNTLWNDFTDKYADYAADQNKVRIAASEVAERARAKGIDVDSYMYGNSDKFMADVVKEIDKLWPKGQAAGQIDDDDDEGDDDDDNRATFVSPQGAASGKPAQRSEPPQKFGALGQAIVDWQQQTGFHR